MTPEQIAIWQSFTAPLAQRLELPPPQHPIGLEVLGSWQDETGQTRYYTGLIVGLFPAPRDWLAGWWYLVRLATVEGDPAIPRPYNEECHEQELQPLNQTP
jgi:hypothetical protein